MYYYFIKYTLVYQGSLLVITSSYLIMLSSISVPVQLILPDKKKLKQRKIDFPGERQMAYEATRDLLASLHSPHLLPDDLVDFIQNSLESNEGITLLLKYYLYSQNQR